MEDDAVLDGLDDVAWADLHHAHGPATDVPGLLRALVDPDGASRPLRKLAKQAGRSVFNEATSQLWGTVFHQGSVWQATAATVAFFDAILTDGPDNADLREFVVSYLHHLAMSYPEDLFPTPFDIEGLIERTEGVIDPGGEPDYSGDMELVGGVWIRDTHLAVERTVPNVAPLVNDPSESVAMEAIAMVASFPRMKAVSLVELEKVAESDGGSRFGHALVSLAVLAPEAGFQRAKAFLDGSGGELQVFAACALVLAEPERVPAQAVAVLTAPLGELAAVRNSHAGSLGVLVGRCTARLPASHRHEGVVALAQQLDGATLFESLSLTGSLLQLAFATSHAPRVAAELDADQRRALEAICAYGAFSVGHGIFSNYSGLLRGWGVPADRESLRVWLDRG